KVLNAQELEKLGKFERYKDVDGDGIPYRTLPGTDSPLAAYFTRGSGHTEKATYTEKPDDYVHLMNRLSKKLETAKTYVPKPEIDNNKDAKIGIIAFGSSHVAVVESRDQLANESKIQTSYFRLKALPLTSDIRQFVEKHDRVYVVE